MLELLDYSLGMSMSDLNAVRQVQRLNFCKVSNQAMIIASEYQVKQERKAMDIIGQKIFEYSHVPNFASIGVKEALEWFIRIERRKMIENDNLVNEIVVCVTGDGMRIGTMNFHTSFIRPRESQNPHDYLPIACYVGSDNKENSDAYMLPHYLEFESLYKNEVLVDDVPWTVQFIAPADMKE